MVTKLSHKVRKDYFLFTELTKRDFKLKYKGTVLGMFWSVLSPLLQLLVMRMVFTQFFGRNTPFYTTYLFSGLIVFNFYTEATNGGMTALQSNRSIITKIRVSKYLFILSKNVSSVINFLIILSIYFIFVAIDGVAFHVRFLMLLYPVLLLPMFCIGVGMILSALQVFFHDTAYLYSVFIIMLRYMSAVFYNVDTLSDKIQQLFLLNPVYVFIKYFRVIVLDGSIPSLNFRLLLLLYTTLALGTGALIYKFNNTKFAYYL